jgi:8-amino-7-oxononanoate synthase
MAFDFIAGQVSAQKSLARYRQRVCLQATDNRAQQQGTQILVDGKPYINFSSNDYLGLNNHEEINKAMQEGIARFGLCASASSLVTGFHYAHKALEDKICQWVNKPRCLIFTSGFSANVALFETLGRETGQDRASFYLDKLSHASMIDGAFSSKAKVKRFAHNNTAQLSRLLSQSDSQNKLIASEGVFSMDGDQAKLTELSSVAKASDAWLYLDDAHSIGVIGEQGQGSASVLTNSNQANITMATFGKAIATSGAFLACDENVHDYLINFARHYIYSTAISPALAWATVKSIELIQQEKWRREKITELSTLFIELLDPSIEVIPSASSIHAIIIGDESKALFVSEQLKNQGIWLTAIRPPTVAVGSSRLRVTICANHNYNNIKHLANCLNKALCEKR